MSLIDTLIDPLRSGYAGKLDAHEWRASRYGALNVFKKQTAQQSTAILSAEDIANIKKSYGIAVKVPVLDLTDVTIGAVRSCVIQPDVNTSRLITLTFVSYVWGFTMVPSMYQNNQIKYELDFQKKMRKYLLSLLKKMDGAAWNKMNVDRNAYFGNGVTAEFPQLANAFQVPKASREDVYNQITAIMNSEDYASESYDVVANSMHESLVNKLARNGTNNADNTRAMLNGFDIQYSNSVVQNTGVRDTLMVIPDGSLSIQNRNDPDAIMGSKIGDEKVWSEVEMPMIDMKVGSYYTKQCTDATQIWSGAETAGLTRTLMEGFEFSTDVCYLTSYISDRANDFAPINKLEISAT